MKVKALKRHGYGGSIHAQGDVYDIANEKHVQILCATKSVRVVLPDSPNMTLNDIADGAVKKNTSVSSGSKKAQKGRYNRKDLTAKKGTIVSGKKSNVSQKREKDLNEKARKN